MPGTRLNFQDTYCKTFGLEVSGSISAENQRKLFLIYLKGFLLCLITLGIYSFWFAKELYEYSVKNIVVKKDDQGIQTVF